MAALPEPTEHEINRAKIPHDIFLSNLIVNHILLFTAISTFGPRYIVYMLLVPALSALALGYTFIRAARVKREDSEFVYVHWQIARRWSKFFAGMLTFLLSVTLLGVLGNMYLGLMKEAVFGLIGGVGLLPTLVSVLILIIVESDSLHHARVGTLPKWAKKKFYGIEEESSAE